MKPWIHPQERRSRIYWGTQIVLGVIAMIATPILVLRDPTRDHMLIGAAVVILLAVALPLAVWELRKIPDEYKYEAEEEDSNEGPG